MYLTLKGLVLRITNYNDTDSLLTVLTQSEGKMPLKARGLRRKNSPLTAACQLMSYSEFSVFAYRDMYIINEARPIELFLGLRQDLEKLSLSSYFAQIAEAISQEDQHNTELLPMVLNSLFALSSLNIDRHLIKAAFELRSCCIAGFSPDLRGCSCCGNIYPDRFDVSEGQLECSTCRRLESKGIRMPLTPGVLDAMRYICACEPKQLFSFQLGPDTIQLLSQITEVYLSTQLEQGFSALDFYKSILSEVDIT